MPDFSSVVEGLDTFVAANLAQGVDSFVTLALEIPVVRNLIERVRRDPQEAKRVLQRLLTIANYRTDSRYANPNDVAISVYGIVLSAADTDIFTITAGVIANAPNCWWAPRVLATIDPRRRNGSDTKTAVNSKAVAVLLSDSFDILLQASPYASRTMYTDGVSFARQEGAVAGYGDSWLIGRGHAADRFASHVNTPTVDSILEPAA